MATNRAAVVVTLIPHLSRKTSRYQWVPTRRCDKSLATFFPSRPRPPTGDGIVEPRNALGCDGAISRCHHITLQGDLGAYPTPSYFGLSHAFSLVDRRVRRAMMKYIALQPAALPQRRTAAFPVRAQRTRVRRAAHVLSCAAPNPRRPSSIGGATALGLSPPSIGGHWRGCVNQELVRRSSRMTLGPYIYGIPSRRRPRVAPVRPSGEGFLRVRNVWVGRPRATLGPVLPCRVRRRSLSWHGSHDTSRSHLGEPASCAAQLARWCRSSHLQRPAVVGPSGPLRFGTNQEAVMTG